MKTFPQHDPLTDAELERLGKFLEGCKGGRAMNIKQLDGLFAALIAGPETVMPSEYYSEDFGGEMSETCEFGSILTSHDGALPSQCRRIFSDVLRPLIGWYQGCDVTPPNCCGLLQ